MQFGFRNKDRETEDLVRVQSVLWEARGREEAEKFWQKWADELHRRLLDTQTAICQVLQGVRTYYVNQRETLSVLFRNLRQY